MQSIRSLKWLSTCLVLLLLANSSLALEIVTHDGHGHGAYQALMDAAMADAPEHGMTDHRGHTAHGDAGTEQGTQTADDCVCDEICCFSTVDFGAIGNQSQQPQAGAGAARPADHYQSLIYDLLLPPPNR